MTKKQLGIYIEIMGRILVLYGILCLLYALLGRFFHLKILILDWIFGWVYLWGLFGGRLIIAYFVAIGFFTFFVGREMAD